MLLMNGMGWSEAAEYGPAPLKSPLYEGVCKDLINKLKAYRALCTQRGAESSETVVAELILLR